MNRRYRREGFTYQLLAHAYTLDMLNMVITTLGERRARPPDTFPVRSRP